MTDILVRDLRDALRVLARAPGTTVAVVLSLGLGIGANSAIFTLINGVLLAPPGGVDRPSELAAVFTSDFSGPLFGTSSYPDYVDFRDGNDVFSQLAALAPTPFSVSTASPAEAGLHEQAGEAAPGPAEAGLHEQAREAAPGPAEAGLHEQAREAAPGPAEAGLYGRVGDGGQSERVFGETVSGNYFATLGVRPALGRDFRPEEDTTPGTHPVAIISHRLWQRRFTANPAAVGSTVLLNGYPFTIVGVAPEGFRGIVRGVGLDLWVPLHMQARAVPGSSAITQRGSRSLFLVGRLKPGVTIAQAQARFDVIARRLHQAYPQNWTNVRRAPRRLTVLSEADARVFPEIRGPLVGFFALLMGVVGLVLLIACANVASLLVARGSARRREFAVRLSVGAGRAQVVRQLLTESVLLAGLAAGAGLLLAFAGARALAAFRPPVPFPFELTLAIDHRVLLFTLAVSVATGVIFGLAPALQAARVDLMSLLREDATRRPTGRSHLRGTLTVVQIALSLVLLVGAGLLLRSLQHARTIDLGFDPENVVVFSLEPKLNGYDTARGIAFYEALLERLAARPGVRSVSAATFVPLTLAGGRRSIVVDGYRPQPGEDMEFRFNTVAPRYLATIGMRLVQGRDFTARDRDGAPPVVIVSETFARRFWPGANPMGKRVSVSGPNGPFADVIGVVKDAKYQTFGEAPQPYYLLPLLQHTRDLDLTMYVRTAGDPAALVPALRDEVRRLDPNLPLTSIQRLTDAIGVTLVPQRAAAALLGGFGLLGVLLAAIGLYGLLAHAVTERTPEIGIRMALGAEAGGVRRMVVAQSARLVLLGVAIGLAGAALASRVLARLLYGVSPTDPLTFAIVTTLLCGVAFLATYLPARRASRIDPAVALRRL